MWFLYGFLWRPMPWTESSRNSWLGLLFHEPVSEYETILTLAAISILGYAIIRIRKKAMPPFLAVSCMSAMYMGCILSLIFILQLSPHVTEANSFFMFEGFLMCLFPLNFIICSIRVTKRIIAETSLVNDVIYKSSILNWCSRILSKCRHYPVIAFVLIVPLLALIIIILTLFGQKPDSFITAFTQTSDWLFSQKAAPAVHLYGAEYLCTAAAQGHKKIVKPFRVGIRGGKRIVINRQICVANAFEELLQEKTPHLRKLLRCVYDAIGCPIAKHIRSPFAADIAYLIIKPFEWFMVLVLYLVETKPENRISKQYLPLE